MTYADPTTWNAGDHHRWVRPTGPACPGCECCSAALCSTAAARELPCESVGTTADFDLDRCPCAALAAARRLLGQVPALDPSHPDNLDRWDASTAEGKYNLRNGTIMGAAQCLAVAGVPVGITRDPTDPHPVVLTIELPGAGQVTWHLPDSPDDYHLPPAAPWDGHDTRTKYARLATWLAATEPASQDATEFPGAVTEADARERYAQWRTHGYEVRECVSCHHPWLAHFDGGCVADRPAQCSCVEYQPSSFVPKSEH